MDTVEIEGACTKCKGSVTTHVQFRGDNVSWIEVEPHSCIEAVSEIEEKKRETIDKALDNLFKSCVNTSSILNETAERMELSKTDAIKLQVLLRHERICLKHFRCIACGFVPEKLTDIVGHVSMGTVETCKKKTELNDND